MNEGYRRDKRQAGEESAFIGYRLVEFSRTDKEALKEVAGRLIPHEKEIVEDWIRLQFSAWHPPGLSRDELKQLFGDIFHDMLACMKVGKLELCIAHLEETGGDLARRNFPYEALIISLHFLEESYLQFLLEPPSAKALDWLLGMDEFLHAALAAIATSYFQVQRKDLLEEAEAGRIVQEGLLPDIPRQVLDLEVASIYLPSGERARIGGDLVDIFMVDDHKAAFIVGDVSGHGLEAASDAATIRSLFRGFIRENLDIADAMLRLNRALIAELAPGQFATALAGVYDVSGQLQLVSAGHPSPVFCDNGCHLVELRGIVLAVDREPAYRVSEIDLKEGALFLAYTDGLIEARNEQGFFGEERVILTVEDVGHAPVRAVAEHLRDEALRFAGGKLNDDMAILVIKRVGKH